MNLAAHLANELGRTCAAHGLISAASAAYAGAAFLAPAWSAPWFNRGLLAKLQRRWAESLRLNRRAAELEPNDPPIWWNLGIAATALGEWNTAREAWGRYGIHVPPATAPSRWS